VLNLYDLTHGNYRVLRTISYPEFPESELIMEAKVTAVNDSEWVTEMTINGMYNGPTDFVSKKDYQLTWKSDGEKILESGSATLESASGQSVRCVWSSIITPEEGFDKFPEAGEFVSLSISPFQIDGNSMSYEWEGTVKEQQVTETTAK